MTWRIGVDVGGTFTDVYAVSDKDRRAAFLKTPSTPDDPSRAVEVGLAALRDNHDVDLTDLADFRHGTTVATNALIQRRGGRIALVTTKGFRDLLEIGRQTRPLIYDLQADHPAPLIPRHMRFEVDERIGPEGQVITALTDPEIDRVVADVIATQPDGVAIGLLFAFLDPAHEQRLAKAFRAAAPELFVSTSADVQPEFREYERLSTTVLNTYLQPQVSRYMRRLEGVVRQASDNAPIRISQSIGGLMSVDQAASFPIRTALSGPAAGVVGAVEAAGRSAVEDVVTLDMGGTSTDVCMIRGERIPLAFGRDIAGFPVRLPSVDVNAVGAGGGSIIHVGPDGLMAVGPESAGALPGPACYGLGGAKPTISDANFLLGRLPGQIAGGDMALDASLARQALSPVAETLGVSIERAALGAIRVVTSNMVRAIRAVSVERGRDPRGAALVPYGGAGGLHAADVAAALGMRRLLVPPSPGLLCARGLLVADLTASFVTTRRTALEGDLSPLKAAVTKLTEQAKAWVDGEDGSGEIETVFDMRYIGQNYELPTPAPDGFDWSDAAVSHLKTVFLQEHETAYGHADATAPIEVVTARITARIPAPPLQEPEPERRDVPPETRPIWFSDSGPTDTAILSRAAMTPDQRHQGPAIIEQADATTLAPPDWIFWLDEAGNLLMEAPE